MRRGFATALIALVTAPALAIAEEGAQPAANPSERRLSPEQVEQVLAEAAARRSAAEKAPVGGTDELEIVPPIYGEIGFTVGTGGYRSAYGSAVYPMGQDGFAAISMSFDRGHDYWGSDWDWGDRPPNR